MKLQNAYNLASFDKFKNSSEKSGFKDSSAGITLARNLTAVDPRIFETKFPELTFVNSGISFNNMGGYARVIESLRLTPLGSFSDSSDLSDDKGKISLSGEGNFLKVYEKEAFSSWSKTEVMQADLQNINLVSQLLSAQNKIYLQEMDVIGYLGIDDNKGLFNNTFFPTSPAAKFYADMLGQELYDAIAGALRSQWDTVSNIYEYKANRVVMPIGMFNKVATQVINTAAGSYSVLKYLKDNFPEVEFLSTVRTLDKLVAFSSNEQAMVMRVPQPLEIGEIIKTSSFRFEVECKFRAAGLDILQKDAGFILTNLAATP